MYVSANGFVTLYGPTAEFRAFTLPDSSAPATDIAAFQNDLSPRNSGDIYYKDYGDYVIIQYNNVARRAGDGFATFQIVLNADGTILFYYKDMQGKVDGASVGCQNIDGDKGITVVNSQPYLKNNLAVRITTNSPWLTLSPPFSGSIAPGSFVDLPISLTAYPEFPGTFYGRLNITTDDPDTPQLLVPVNMTVNEGPHVTVGSPNHGNLYVVGGTASITASVNSPYGISRVEFLDGANVVGSFSPPQYNFAFQTLAFGSHAISARAIDNLGAAGISQTLVLDVQHDSNSNGLGDAWEMQAFGNLTQTRDADFDGDGWTNLEEFQAGLNAAQFDDADGDGVGDGAEIKVYHTDPNSTDSDGDGMDDGYETRHHLDPKADDSKIDKDGDGLTNGEEAALGTDPENPDTDGDNTPDGADFWATSKVFAGNRVPERSYIAMELHATAAYPNNLNQFAFYTDGTALNRQESYIGYSVEPSPSATRIAFSGGLPDTTPNGLRLKYGLVVPIGLNDSGKVLGIATGLYEWNPEPNHIYPPGTGTGPYFFPGDPGHFWAAAEYSRTVLWNMGAVSDIVVPNSTALALNNSGEVLLSAIVDNETHAVLWKNGVPGDLGAGNPQGFNNQGVVVGDKNNFAGIWRGAGFERLPDFSFGGSGAFSVNDRQEVAGYSFMPPTYAFRHGCAWRDQEKLDLDAGVNTGSSAVSINNRSQVVGQGSDSRGILWQNNHTVRLSDRIDAINWRFVRPSFINDNGMIVALAEHLQPNGVFNTFNALLVPVDLMVDGNRDGEMSNDNGLVHDRDLTSESRPYRFWLNDDDDTEIDSVSDGDGHTTTSGPSEADKDPVTRFDYSLHKIVSKRNLEDFSRLWIYFGGLHDLIVSGEIRVGLRWKNVTPGTTPAINIYPSADGEGSDSYLKDDAAAQAQITGEYNDAVRDMTNVVQTISTTGTFIFKQDYWNNFSLSQPKKCFLFEGAKEGRGRLEVVLFDKNLNEIGCGGSLWLDLKNIKKMYVRAKGMPLEGIAEPWTNENPAPTEFVLDPNDNDFDPPADEDKTVLIFVHGIHPPNTGPDLAYEQNINAAETLLKRLHHAGFHGRFGFYKWPALNPAGFFTSQSGFEFNQSEYRGFKYGRGLASFAATFPADYQRHIIAHSQGNAVVGAAFQNYGLQARTWIVTQGAIPIGCYDADPTLNAFVYDTLDDAAELGYRGFLGDRVSTRIVNFFNEDDRVTGTIWEINQDLFKPASTLSQLVRVEYWFFKGLRKMHVKRFLGSVQLDDREINDIHESMAMGVQSRTRSIGHGANVHGHVDSTIDLHAEFDYGNEHGSQWERGVQQKALPYYDALLREIR
ncbi:MAG TPA: Ig-like domain-containing protein [Chthoniobacterales bacterium]